MKNEEENKLNEVWETPMLTALNLNEDTKTTKHTSGSDGLILS
jgi:hypothetical protein